MNIQYINGLWKIHFLGEYFHFNDFNQLFNFLEAYEQQSGSPVIGKMKVEIGQFSAPFPLFIEFIGREGVMDVSLLESK